MLRDLSRQPDLFIAPPEPCGEPDLSSYDHILVAFSGGKDSLAALLHVIETGHGDRCELHHHEIDGQAETFMDWACTPAYCRAVAAALDLPLYSSFREGGFLRELRKTEDRTAAVVFERPDGTLGRAGGERGKIGTRGRFPQVSPDLRVRWCSAVLKIDVLSAAICNQDRFVGKRLLVVTGERAEESGSRARYKTFEPHRTDANKRPVDYWRPVHAWKEAEVWHIIQRQGIVPHPAYQLGWGRLSCMSCIFGSPNQWATIRAVYPHRFEAIAAFEQASGSTIQRAQSVRELADRGMPYTAALGQPALAALADKEAWVEPVVVPAGDWRMPAGAGGESVGPT